MERTGCGQSIFMRAFAMSCERRPPTQRCGSGSASTVRNAAVASRLLNEALEAGVIVIEDPTAGKRSRSYLPFWASPSVGGIWGDHLTEHSSTSS